MKKKKKEIIFKGILDNFKNASEYFKIMAVNMNEAAENNKNNVKEIKILLKKIKKTNNKFKQVLLLFKFERLPIDNKKISNKDSEEEILYNLDVSRKYINWARSSNKMNGKNKIIKEWLDKNKKRHRIVCFVSLDRNKEAEYKEIRKGVWQKVPGTEKDLGSVKITKNK